MKKYFIIILILLLPTYSFSEEQLKSDQDRIQDIHKIAEIMEEYKRKYGEYPFSENWRNVPKGMVAVPILCNLSERPLPEEFQHCPPLTSCYMMKSSDFEAYLSEAFGQKIILPKDDRPTVINGKNVPFFYQFKFDGVYYFVAFYSTEPLPHANKLSEGWYKYEVGSVEIPDRMTRKYLDIKD